MVGLLGKDLEESCRGLIDILYWDLREENYKNKANPNHPRYKVGIFEAYYVTPAMQAVSLFVRELEGSNHMAM
jgi:hypothetical protein